MAKDPIIKHIGVIRNGQVKLYRSDLYRDCIRALEGKEIELIIKKKHNRTSKDTHGYYRGGIIKTCLQYESFAHMTEEDLHEMLAEMFLSYQKLYVVGEKKIIRTFVKSMADLSQEETNEFIKQVEAFVTGEGVELLPAENYETDKYRTVKI